jgi:photosystem II stability/assembly factor-like uncharacterized protein
MPEGFPMLKRSLAPLASACALLLSACGGGDDTTASAPTALPATLSLSAAAAQTEVAGTSVFTTSVGRDTTGYTLHWDFGDGTTGTGADPDGRMSHRYEQPGAYTITLTLTNSAGDRRTATAAVTAGHFDRLSGLVCSGPDRTGWCWQQPRPSGNAISDITFIDAQTGWAVGMLGQILKSVDGGARWTAQSSGTTAPLTQARFTDARTGWVVGDTATLLRTTDGGSTWEAQASGLSTPYAVMPRLWAVNAQKAVITTGSATRVTEDGGQTWRASTVHPSEVSEDGRLWQLSGNQLTVSTDLGATARTVLNTDSLGELQQLSIASSTLAWVIGTEPLDAVNQGYYPRTLMLWQTTDGGTTWQKRRPSGIDDDHGWSGTRISSLTLFTDGTGWVHNGMALSRTTDGGLTWRTVTTPAALGSNSGSVIREARDGNTLTLAGYGAAYRTTDGGSTWTTYQVLEESPSNGVYTVPTLRLAGSSTLLDFSGRTYLSRDNGGAWQRVLGLDKADSGNGLHALWFFDARNGLALGSNGSLLDTTDGGTTWSRRTMADAAASGPVTGKLQFLPSQTPAPSAQSGWMLRAHLNTASYGYGPVGQPSTSSIWRTRDGGKSWEPPRSSATFVRATDVHFIDARQGWVITNPLAGGSTVQASEDGGDTWTTQATLAQVLTSVQFLDHQTGVAVGTGGTIARTTDGGRHWTLRASGVTADLNRVRLSGDGGGWIAGDNGTLLHTSDRGMTWRRVTLLTATALNDVVFSSALDGWVLGDNGLLLVTRDGGATWFPQATGSSEHLLGAHFADPRTGWLVGSNGTILATATAGR